MHKSRYLVDTDVIINYLKGNEKAKDFMIGIIDGKASGFFSVITEAELVTGALDDEDEASIYALLDFMDPIDVDRKIAVSAGRLRHKYHNAYNTKLPDAIIAATSKENGLILATANEKHFIFIEEIEKEYVKDH